MKTVLFNTPDGSEFLGIRADDEFGGSLEKARKGTEAYKIWLEKYRAARGGKKKQENDSQQGTLFTEEQMSQMRSDAFSILSNGPEKSAKKKEGDYSAGDSKSWEGEEAIYGSNSDEHESEKKQPENKQPETKEQSEQEPKQPEQKQGDSKEEKPKPKRKKRKEPETKNLIIRDGWTPERWSLPYKTVGHVKSTSR